jgi:putative nucleotidyltransferase with HDIG domain
MIEGYPRIWTKLLVENIVVYRYLCPPRGGRPLKPVRYILQTTARWPSFRRSYGALAGDALKAFLYAFQALSLVFLLLLLVDHSATHHPGHFASLVLLLALGCLPSIAALYFLKPAAEYVFMVNAAVVLWLFRALTGLPEASPLFGLLPLLSLTRRNRLLYILGVLLGLAGILWFQTDGEHRWLTLAVYFAFSAVAAVAGSRSTYNDVLKISMERGMEAFLLSVEARDKYTEGHSKRVAVYAWILAEALQNPELPPDVVFQAGLVHDIGKISIADSVLLKDGKLTSEEYDQIKQHPIIGAKILEEFGSAPLVVEAARYHHERWDGTGYGAGLKGTEIPLIARVLAIADTFDAMTSKRAYRHPFSPAEARHEIIRCSGQQFDPALVQVFRKVYPRFLSYFLSERRKSG